jgi:ribosomal-protein-serine acetyltransferase
MFSRTVDGQIMLRTLQLQHLQTHYALLDASRHHLCRYEPWVNQATLNSQRQYILYKSEQWFNNQGMCCGIWYRETPTQAYQLAGNINYEVTAKNGTAEIGYWLGDGYTGRGIMTRAAHAVIDYLFSEMSIRRALLVIVTENTASTAVAERLGFALQCIIPHDMYLYTRSVDRAYYVLNTDDWTRRHVTTENRFVAAPGEF